MSLYISIIQDKFKAHLLEFLLPKSTLKSQKTKMFSFAGLS